MYLKFPILKSITKGWWRDWQSLHSQFGYPETFEHPLLTTFKGVGVKASTLLGGGGDLRPSVFWYTVLLLFTLTQYNAGSPIQTIPSKEMLPLEENLDIGNYFFCFFLKSLI